MLRYFLVLLLTLQIALTPMVQAAQGAVVKLSNSDVQYEIGTLTENAGWSEGSLPHILLHGLAGCAAAEAQGASCAAGAAGAVAASVLSGYFENNPVDVDESLSAEEQENQRLQKEQKIASFVSAFSGFVFSGGDADNVSTSSSIGESAIANNRQLHIKAEELIEEYADEFAREMGWCDADGTCFTEDIERAKAVLTQRTLARVDAWHNIVAGDYAHDAADDFLDRLAATEGGWVPGTNQTQRLFLEAPETTAFRNAYLNALMLAQTYDSYALVDAVVNPGASVLNQAFYVMMEEATPGDFPGAEYELAALRENIKNMPEAELTELLWYAESGIGESWADGAGAAALIAIAQENPNFYNAYENVPPQPTGADLLELAQEITAKKLNGEPLTADEQALIALIGPTVATAVMLRSRSGMRSLTKLFSRIKRIFPANTGRPPVVNPTSQQLAAAERYNVDAGWVDADGNLDYPPNNGFAALPQ